jgi:hypothetical protein
VPKTREKRSLQGGATKQCLKLSTRTPVPETAWNRPWVAKILSISPSTAFTAHCVGLKQPARVNRICTQLSRHLGVSSPFYILCFSSALLIFWYICLRGVLGTTSCPLCFSSSLARLRTQQWPPSSRISRRRSWSSTSSSGACSGRYSHMDGECPRSWCPQSSSLRVV